MNLEGATYKKLLQQIISRTMLNSQTGEMLVK